MISVRSYSAERTGPGNIPRTCHLVTQTSALPLAMTSGNTLCFAPRKKKGCFMHSRELTVLRDEIILLFDFALQTPRGPLDPRQREIIATQCFVAVLTNKLSLGACQLVRRIAHCLACQYSSQQPTWGVPVYNRADNLARVETTK